MGYHMDYEQIGQTRPQPTEKHRVSGVIAVVLICVLVMGAVAIKTVGLPWVETFLIPGDPEVTQAALQDMVSNLQEGQSIGEAVTAFCREIVENAK